MQERLRIATVIGQHFNTYAVRIDGVTLAEFATRDLAEEYIQEFDNPDHEVPFTRIG